MNREQPDLLRQSDGFGRIHGSLTVSLIATSRESEGHGPSVRVCHLDDTLAEVRAANLNPTFDYLPVEKADGNIVGLLSAKNSMNSTGVDGELPVRDRLVPLSETDLIGADATILDFISRVRRKPLLVVSGGRINGLVAWSDLQKLPVRAAIFALVTGFELTMYEAIKAVFPEGDGWREHLSDNRLEGAEQVYGMRGGNESDVELLLCTEFCDKRTILKKCLPFGSQAKRPGVVPMSKGKFEDEVKRIEDLRNPLAHASSYAMKWDDVANLRKTVAALMELRQHIRKAVSSALTCAAKHKPSPSPSLSTSAT